MQATSIVALPAAVNGVEAVGDVSASGQGLKVSSSLQGTTQESLFTTILQQGISQKGTSKILLSGTALTGATGNGDDDTTETAVDVCGLLMQLLVMNSTTAQAPAEAAQTEVTEGAAGTPAITDAFSALTTELTAVTAQPEGALLQGLGSIAQDTSATLTPAEAFLAKLSAAGAGTSGQAAGQSLTQTVVGTEVTTQADTILSQITKAVADSMSQEQGVTEAVQSQETTDFGLYSARNPRLQTAGASQAENTTAGKTPGTIALGQALSGTTSQQTGETGQAVTAAAASSSGDSETISLNFQDKNKQYDSALPTMTGGSSFTSMMQTSSLLFDKTTAVEKALHKFTDDFKGIQGNSQQINIVLEPESMGTLTIQLTKTASGISAKIKSEDREVIAAIAGQIQKLVTTMENKGIHLEDMDVSFGRMDLSTGLGNQQSGQSGGENARSQTMYSGAQETGTKTAEFSESVSVAGASGDSSIDYRV